MPGKYLNYHEELNPFLFIPLAASLLCLIWYGFDFLLVYLIDFFLN